MQIYRKTVIFSLFFVKKRPKNDLNSMHTFAQIWPILNSNYLLISNEFLLYHWKQDFI